jgi:putative CocE/NonD family hydrolase
MRRPLVRLRSRTTSRTAAPILPKATIPGLLAVILFMAAGCEHDPVVLEEHPISGQDGLGWTSQSLYLEVDDGVRIALDIHLPRGYPGGDEFPTILELTRYWRHRGGGLSYPIRRATTRGFAYVVMDERGTGASFGAWPSPLSDRALEDAKQVIDWIVDQDWSNGRVGATGVSYPGMASQQLAAAGHPALRAIVPQSDTYDQYEDLLFPGGVFNEAFIQAWSDLVFAMDRNSTLEYEGSVYTLSPVQSDPTGDLLDQAIAGHGGNLRVFEAVANVTFRDDPVVAGMTLDDISTHRRIGDLASSGVAIYHWGSWMDGGSADGVIRQFMESPVPQRATIGSWTHDLWGNANPFSPRGSPASPGGDQQWEEALNFFEDVLLKDKPLPDRTLRYFTMGENLWKSTSTWPVPGTEMLRLYLAEGGGLTESAPSTETGADPYEVDFEAESSPTSRWLSPLGIDAWYQNRITDDQRLLVYETPPLAEDLEVTGYPVVDLHLASSHTDGAFFVYLEDVDPNGPVRYITEGVLRGIHRKVSVDPSPWTRPTPYHSFRSEDAQPLVPGEVAELALGMHPTSVLFRAGHRIRIAIAGHDASAFRRVPAEGTPEILVQRNSRFPSYIELPVVRDPS